MEKPKQDHPNQETRLFHLTRNWFQRNPGALIPNDSWTRKIQEFGISHKYRSFIEAEADSVTIGNLALIQVLASLSLGESTERLAQIIEHTGIRVLDIADSGLTTLVIKRDRATLPNERLLPRYRIVRECMKAFDLIPEKSSQLGLLGQYENTNPDLTMSLLFIDRPDLWHGTKLERYFEAREAKSTELPEKTDEMPEQVFTLGTQFGYEYSDEEVIELLRRAGHLCEGLTSENGFSITFYRHVLEHAASENNPDSLAIVKAINSVSDPSYRDIFANKIVRALCSQVVRDQYGALQIWEYLSLLDQEKYSDVLQSRVLRLCVIDKPPKAPDTYEADFYQFSSVSLFEDLANELFTVPEHGFDSYHFKALASFAMKWPKAHRGDDFDLNKLVYHVMRGLEHFLDKDFAGNVVAFQDTAITRAGLFLEVAVKLAEPNYKLLNRLNAQSQGLLVISGYDIRRLTKMTYKDKGRVLSDELGV